MPVVVVNPLNGKYLDQRRGESRGETPNLEEAQVFETVGKAKIAYNHAWAYSRRHNKWFHQRVAQGHPVGNMTLDDIPDFVTKTVKVVLTDE